MHFDHLDFSIVLQIIGLIATAFAIYVSFSVKSAVTQVKFEFEEKIGEIKTDIGNLKADIGYLKGRIDSLDRVRS
jgi:hypothetical protein